MSYLLCARCDVELFDDPHTDTDLEDVCGGCCRVCNPISERPLLDASDGSTVDCSPAVDPSSGDGRYGTATVETQPVGTRPASPVAGNSRSPEVGTESLAAPVAGVDGQKPGQGRADTTNEEATAQRDLPVA